MKILVSGGTRYFDSSHGTISLREIIDYVEGKTGCRAIISSNGDNAPYNGECQFSINTDKAQIMGFEFSNLRDWIFELPDYYIASVLQNN